MAAFTPLSKAQISSFLSEFSLGELVSADPVAGGSVNTNYRLVTTSGPVFLRVYEEQGEAGARREANLLVHLAAAGVPTPAPLLRRDGGRTGALAGKPAALFPWREGGMRCQASVRPADAARVGEALARVHLVGAPPGLDLGPGRFGPEFLRQRLVRIGSSPDAALAAEAPRLGAALDTALSFRANDLPAGLVHGDVFRDNVLWDAAGGISAVLDFESASRGTFAYDVMVTVLAWCFGDALDLGLAGALVGGYAAVRPISELEWSGLYAEGLVAALRFTVTRITDYAMRAGEPGAAPRVMKDWRRFAARHAALVALGPRGLVEPLRRAAENPVS